MGSNPGRGTASYFSEVGDYLGDVTITLVNSALHSFGLLNLVPAAAAVKAGKSPLLGGR